MAFWHRTSHRVETPRLGRSSCEKIRLHREWLSNPLRDHLLTCGLWSAVASAAGYGRSAHALDPYQITSGERNDGLITGMDRFEAVGLGTGAQSFCLAHLLHDEEDYSQAINDHRMEKQRPLLQPFSTARGIHHGNATSCHVVTMHCSPSPYI